MGTESRSVSKKWHSILISNQNLYLLGKISLENMTSQSGSSPRTEKLKIDPGLGTLNLPLSLSLLPPLNVSYTMDRPKVELITTAHMIGFPKMKMKWIFLFYERCPLWTFLSFQTVEDNLWISSSCAESSLNLGFLSWFIHQEWLFNHSTHS